MAQHSIVKQAKQGDPRAIAYLITRTLKKYSIRARANLKGPCLRVLLEAEHVPHQSTMVKLVTQGMQKLNVATIRTVKLYGRQKGEPVPAWRQVIELTPTPASNAMASKAELDSSEIPIFRLDDLDPEAMILFPVEKVQLDDLDPEAMILFPVEPAASSSEVSTDLLDNPSLLLSEPVTAIGADPEIESPLTPQGVKLPKRLTGLLLVFLGLQVIISVLTLIHSLLNAGSLSLYTGLDLANTNRPFASLLSGVLDIADFLLVPLTQGGWWIGLMAILLSLVWLHRLHASLKVLFQGYPISAWGAVLRFVLPLYNLWGISNTLLTFTKQTALQPGLDRPSQTINRLTIWFYFFLFTTVGLESAYLWLIIQFPRVVVSLWFDVARDAAICLLCVVWLRLVRLIWRVVCVVYRERVAVPTKARPVRRSKLLNLRAVLLGSGASLLSLILFNCLLGVIAAFVFVSNGLRPEAIIPTFYDSESLLTLVLLGSVLCIGLGGFLAAYLAPSAELRHALGVGGLLTLIGLALQRSGLFPALDTLPFWFQSASALTMIPAALIGGGLRQWLKSL